MSESLTSPSRQRSGLPGEPFPAALRRRYDRLSLSSRQFLDFVEEHPEALLAESFERLDRPDPLRAYPMLRWPLFLDASVIRQLETAMADMTHLVRQVPGRLLDGDPERMAAFYGFSSRDAALLNTLASSPRLLDGLVARGDFVLTADGLRCLEMNYDANLGGWQADVYGPLYRGLPVLDPFFDGLGRGAGWTSPPRALFRHLAGSYLERGGLRHDTLNLAFVKAEDKDVGRLNELFAERLGAAYREVLEELRPGLGGRVGVCRYSQLEERDGHLYLEGDPRRPVQLLVEHCRGRVPRSVLSAWLSGKVMLVNGPLMNVFDDKRNLALLSRFADRLPAADREKAERWVPWTRRVEAGFVSYRGERAYLPELLRADPGRWVLKSARGMAGDDLRIGRALDPAAWDTAVDDALAAGDWIVQEHLEPVPVVSQSGARGHALHDAVFGLFQFGDLPGGGWLRVRRRRPGERPGEAPVNSSQGARVTIYFEVDDVPGEPVRNPVAPARPTSPTNDIHRRKDTP